MAMILLFFKVDQIFIMLNLFSEMKPKYNIYLRLNDYDSAEEELIVELS